MATSTKQVKTCPKGHQFYKSSDCPVCPKCEQEKKAESAFLAELAAPARRALEGQKITTLEELARWSEKELLKLHGFGPATLPKLRAALEKEGLNFKK